VKGNWDVPQGFEAQQKQPIPHDPVMMHTSLMSAHAEALISQSRAAGEWPGDGPCNSTTESHPEREITPKQLVGVSAMPWSTALVVLRKLPGYARLQRSLEQVWGAWHMTHTAPCCISCPPKCAKIRAAEASTSALHSHRLTK
jgi:hypothetical protein